MTLVVLRGRKTRLFMCIVSFRVFQLLSSGLAAWGFFV